MPAGIHQVIRESVRLFDLYPAVPEGITSAEDVRRFWNDPKDQAVLDTIWEWMCDADFVGQQEVANGRLTRADLRSLFDAELPHSHWGGLGHSTYGTDKPEIRGLLLAFVLGRAQGRVIPPLFVDFLGWMSEEGWDEFGMSGAATDSA